MPKTVRVQLLPAFLFYKLLPQYLSETFDFQMLHHLYSHQKEIDFIVNKTFAQILHLHHEDLMLGIVSNFHFAENKKIEYKIMSISKGGIACGLS